MKYVVIELYRIFLLEQIKLKTTLVYPIHSRLQYLVCGVPIEYYVASYAPREPCVLYQHLVFESV